MKAAIHYESADTHTSFDIHNRLELFHRELQLQHKQTSAVLNTVGVFIDSTTTVFPHSASEEKKKEYYWCNRVNWDSLFDSPHLTRGSNALVRVALKEMTR